MLQDSWMLTLEKLQGWVEELITFLPNLVASIIVIALFYLISSILKKRFRILLKRFVNKRSLRNFVTSAIQWLILCLGLFVALTILNLGNVVTSILAGAGVAGVVLGFAIKEILSNYFSGLSISLSEPFIVGDFVDIGGDLGVVKNIKSRTTLIETPQGQVIEVPNQKVINNSIINYTTTGERRIDIRYGISYDSDLDKAKRVAVETIKNIEGVLKDKQIQFYYEDFGDSSLKFLLRVWMKFGNSQSDYFELRSEIISKLLEAYNQNDIVMPYPITIIKPESV